MPFVDQLRAAREVATVASAAATNSEDLTATAKLEAFLSPLIERIHLLGYVPTVPSAVLQDLLGGIDARALAMMMHSLGWVRQKVQGGRARGYVYLPEACAAMPPPRAHKYRAQAELNLNRAVTKALAGVARRAQRRA
jgi:hypothetical protein